MARLRRARARDAGEIAFDQRDAGALHRDIGAGAHGDADIGLGERRRVVDAVAGHGDDAAFAAQPPHDRVLLLGQHLGLDLGDAELARRPPAAVVRLSPVSMTMRMPSARRAAKRRRRCRLDRIGDRDDAGRLAVDRDEHRGRAVARAARRRALRASPLTMPELVEQLRVADARPAAADRAGDALAGDARRNPRRPAARARAPSPRRRSRRRADARSSARGSRASDKHRRLRRSPARRHDRDRRAACLRSACRSCRPPACRSSRSAPAPRHS